MTPSAARKIWLDHRFDECASVLVLNKRLVKKARCKTQGNFVHLSVSRCRTLPIQSFVRAIVSTKNCRSRRSASVWPDGKRVTVSFGSVAAREAVDAGQGLVGRREPCRTRRITIR